MFVLFTIAICAVGKHFFPGQREEEVSESDTEESDTEVSDTEETDSEVSHPLPSTSPVVDTSQSVPLAQEEVDATPPRAAPRMIPLDQLVALGPDHVDIAVIAMPHHQVRRTRSCVTSAEMKSLPLTWREKRLLSMPKLASNWEEADVARIPQPVRNYWIFKTPVYKITSC